MSTQKKVLLSDLYPLHTTVTLREGTEPLDVRPILFPSLVMLILKHADACMALYNESQKPKPQYEPLLVAVPELIADVICAGIPELEDQRDDVKILPPGPQLQLLTAAWEVSVPDPKALIESLSKLMAQSRRLAGSAREVAQANQLARQSSPPAEPSSPTSNAGTTAS